MRVLANWAGAEARTRRDGGAGASGNGVELIGGMRLAASRLRVDAKGRLLALHSGAAYRERGVGVTLGLGTGTARGCRCRRAGATLRRG